MNIIYILKEHRTVAPNANNATHWIMIFKPIKNNCFSCEPKLVSGMFDLGSADLASSLQSTKKVLSVM